MSLVGDQALTSPAEQQFPNNQENKHFDDTKPKSQQNEVIGGWSFLQCLYNNTGIARVRGVSSDECTEKVYTHPLLKRSASKLSEKSLEMCTESLGCESGSESGDDITLLDVEVSVPMAPPPNRLEINNPRMIIRRTSFPPPLKSASRSNYGYNMMTFRENGRVVVRAIRVSLPPPCFVADRSDGRLRLCFLDDSSLSFDNHADEEENGNEEIEFNVESYEEEEEEEKEDEQNDDEEEFREKETEEKNEEKEEEAEEGIEETTENFESKIGIEKFLRPSNRCKENGNELVLLNGKQRFWVAT